MSDTLNRFQTSIEPSIPRTNRDKRIVTAYNIFNAHGVGEYMFHKTTRAGCTTALVAESLNRREVFLVVVPTNKIADETVIADSITYSDRDDCNVIHILSNHACIKNQELCEEFPDLEKLPILPLADKCDECDLYESCPVTRILRENGCDGYALTYQKIVALMLSSITSPNTTAEVILTEISCVHNAILDEVHEIQYGKATGITIYNDAKKGKEKQIDLEKYVDMLGDFDNLRTVVSHFGSLMEEKIIKDAQHRTYINTVADGSYRHKLSITIQNNWCIGEEIHSGLNMAAYSEIIKLTQLREEYELSMDDILALYEILNIVTSEQVVIHGIKDRGHTRVRIVTIDHVFQRMLKSYIRDLQNRAIRVIMTSATICSHDYDQYFGGQGKPKRITFGMGGDPMNTNSKMMILADSKKYGMVGRGSRSGKKEEILQKITTLLEVYGDDDCIVITLSKTDAVVLEKDLKAFGHPHSVIYYKAPETMGVSAKARVMIAVGVADKPGNAFDAICGTKEESLILREEAVHCDTWQAWSRVKDPGGEVPSLVFALGCTLRQCENCVTWGFGRKIEIPTTEGEWRNKIMVKLERQNITQPTVKKCTSFDDMLESARLHKTFKKDLTQIEKGATFCQKPPIYNIIGHIWQKVAHIYNVTKLDFLFNHLVNRYDTFAEQNHSGTQYFRVTGGVSETLIHNHIAGKVTIGAYSTSVEGTCKWICFDVDAHFNRTTDTHESFIEKVNQAEADLQNITAFLDSVNIRYLVEESGSPHSYHVWILLTETPVEKAYYFARAIAKEAGFSGEVNPKQRTWNKHNQYGNLVKLPFALHKKHGTNSSIRGWDGETGEIAVYDLTDLEVPKDVIKSRKKRKGVHSPARIAVNGIRPCIKAAIGKCLVGSQGHWMRIAVVREYYNNGLTDPEKLAELFSGQGDYDFSKSFEKVNSIINEKYGVWSQATLLEHCADFLMCGECDRYDCKGAD